VRGRILANYLSGNLQRRTMLFVFYFGTLALAAFVFPESYDWQSSVISNLLSPHRNPQFHWLAKNHLPKWPFRTMVERLAH
jgi:hypothetical protein